MLNGFDARLRKLRHARGMTQEAVAAQLGVTCQAVSKWETGAAAPDLGLIVPLATLLGVSTDTLLGNADRRAEWEARWQQALRRGEAETLRVSEDALRELSEDGQFLLRRACDEYFLGARAEDAGERRRLLEQAVRHFKALDGGRDMLIRALVLLDRREEAIAIARADADSDALLRLCLRGEDLERHRRALVHKAVNALVTALTDEETAEALLLLLRGRGHGDYGDALSALCQSQAADLAREGRGDAAMGCLQRALAYLRQYRGEDGLPPLFLAGADGEAKVDAEYPYGAFRAFLRSESFAALRGRADYASLLEEADAL